MCLQSIDEVHIKNNTIYKGYKILRKEKHRKTYDSLVCHRHSRGYSLNKWYKNIHHELLHTEYSPNFYRPKEIYKSGFHILTDLDQAKEYFEEQSDENCVLVEVEYKQRTYSGIDGSGYDCDIAEYIKIVKEIYPIDEYEFSVDPGSHDITFKGYLPKIKDDIKVVLYYKNRKVQELDCDIDRTW